MAAYLNIIIGGLFHAAVLFLTAAGLQIVFGVQRIVNLACGSFYALGAYFGITVLSQLEAGSGSTWLVVPALIISGVVLAIAIGPATERLLRFMYERDEHFQILLTFALVLIFEDVIRFFWGTSPVQAGNTYLNFGQLPLGEAVTIPAYNIIVIIAAAVIAVAMGWMLQRTRIGRIVRATAENRSMSEALGVRVAVVFSLVFTVGVALGTVGGALAAPVSAASIDMGIELIVEAFAVVIIGGLGSMTGALVGAIIVGVTRSIFIATYPELEMLAIYAIVVAVLALRPRGLFGKAEA